jgi:hypothetical protein
MQGQCHLALHLSVRPTTHNPITTEVPMLQNVLNIRPDHKGHVNLEKRFTDYLTSKGFQVFDGTYHNNCNRELSKALRYRNSGTSLAIRGRADRLAVHKKLDIDFEWDAKTHENYQYRDATIEALPLAHHIMDGYLGKVTLYVLEDADGNDRCFWVSSLPPIREIQIPKRQDAQQTEWFRKTLSVAFPGVRIRTGTVSKGSGDPFAIIDAYHVRQMPDWHKVIDTIVAVRSRYGR